MIHSPTRHRQIFGRWLRHAVLVLATGLTAQLLQAEVTPPDPAWVNKTIAGGTEIWSSIALGADETLYFGTQGGLLIALDKYNQSKWTFDNSSVGIRTSPTLDLRSSRVFFGDEYGVFHCLNTADGTEANNGPVTTTSGYAIRSSAAIGKELSTGTSVYVLAGDGYLYCFDANNLSSYKWRQNVNNANSNELDASPVIGKDGKVYVGSSDGKFYQVNADGTGLTVLLDTGYAIVAAAAVGANGWIYFGSYSYTLYALDPAAPAATRLKWIGQVSGPIKTAPVISSTGIVYVGSDDDHVYGFDAYTDHAGAAISPTYTSAQLAAQMCAGLAIDNRGIVYGGPYSGSVFYALTNNLTTAWHFSSVPGTTIGSIYAAPAIGPDGAIYIGDRSGQVFKFPGGAFPAGAPLMASVWPAFQRDMWRSGDGSYNAWPRDPNATIQELSPYYGGSNSYAYAINAAGAVAGMADGYPAYPNNWGFAYNGAYWAASATSPTLDYPYGWNSSYYVTAWGINSGGDVVGYNGNNAFVRYVNNSGANLPSLNSSASQAYGISTDRTIVGFSGSNAAKWTYDGTSYKANPLGNLFDGGSSVPSYAYGLNYQIRVIGKSKTSSTGPYHAFRTDPGVPINTSPNADMGTLSGTAADTSVSWGISDSGYVVGSSKASSGETHAYRFTGSTYQLYSWMDLGTLGGNYSEAYGVNNAGQVVGKAKNSAGSYRAFLWVSGKGMIDLNTKIPSGSTGWVLTSAESINDDGTIVGLATHNGSNRAFVMKPTP